ncbi:tRNA pseudouridine(55) synthase TruB [Bacteroidales bacterium OttesenSCG-928-C03]|nr:tRNA pseudouridine(55) synthase TruB [Bacteroidales bacterium OttesenSCG-928-C03]MDL2326705.1 tRNA pseudouridine(55) synthase TruB [Bacteroidales bacterium OttesenSCG-928-A14]
MLEKKKFIHNTRFSLPPLSIDPEGSVLVFDKPYCCTSFDLVGRVKRWIRENLQVKMKVGHAGTLDPLATGVMIICVGPFTKKIDQYQGMDKEYTGTIRLGATTPSYDLEKEVDQQYPISHITEEMIRNAAQHFVGEIDQVPPLFSAVKIAGKRAYEYAREGEEVEIKSKKITIHEFEITRIALPDVDFRIVCSKGTYIRSIARDFGLELDSGAHLTALRRTRIGDFRVEDAYAVLGASEM